MKLILSRKGFDSEYGGIPSPILPDGRLLSLPIPSKADQYTFANLNAPDINVGALINDLSGGKHGLDTKVHLDPDLDRGSEGRLPGWRPALGQTGTAQSHLQKMQIDVGDVFLFFGWFREVERKADTWRYIRSAPGQHVIFGWIEVSEVLPIVRDRDRCIRQYPWIANHPHVLNPKHYADSRNTLYVAAKNSRFSRGLHFGGGIFPKYAIELRLTQPGSTKSVWSLPTWMMPKLGRPPLSYNRNLDKWSEVGNAVILRTAAKGQEFVLDGSVYPEAESWISGLVQRNA